LSSEQALSHQEREELIQLRQRVAELEQYQQDYQQARKQLQTQAFYHEILDNAPFLIFAKDTHGRLLFGNQMLGDLLDCPVASLIGKRDEEYLPLEHAQHNQETDQDVLTTRQAIQRDEPVLRADGSLRHYHSIKFPLFDEQGNIYGVGGVSTDVTERVQTEQELRVFQTLIERTQDGIGMASLDGVLIYANESYQHITGQQVGATLREHFTPEKAAELEQEVLPSVMQRGKWEGLLTVRRPDGEERIIESSTFVLKDNDGTPKAMANIFRDVTQRQAREAELQVFKSTVDLSTDGIAMVSPEGIITYANTAIKTMLGYGEDEFVGQPVAIAFGSNTEEPIQIIQHVIEQNIWQGIHEYYRKDGSTFPVSLSVFSILDAQGNAVIFPGIVRDLTDIRQAEAERAALQEQIIQSQRHTLLELSAPLLPISEHIVIMPLIGSIDTQRAQQIMETLLEGVAQHRAEVAIVDITGVQVVDTQVANALIQAAQAVQLLGAQVILTGIGPTMAQTLISLGVDMSSIITRGRLQNGIAYAMEQGR
jgi:rsbT co-antagonist protein RsbR